MLLVCASTEAKAFRSLRQLDNADAQKLESLVRWHRDTGDTVKWLREHQHLFKMPILEPPMLSCNVPDKKYVHAIEACFNTNDLQVRSLYFICTNYM